MAGAETISIHLADAAHARRVSELHADSWRRHYRGSYADRYLDGDLVAERLALWSERLRASDDRRLTLVAEVRSLFVGFAHVVLDADPRWGALVDNLHVAHRAQRRGIGTLLLGSAGQMVTERRPGSGLFLWVLEQNEDAQAFYRSRRGVLGDRALVRPPAGDPRNLAGIQWRIRVLWPDPAVLNLS
jgi:ribosomal protein S18 acetylase RimI-like enzyme